MTHCITPLKRNHNAHLALRDSQNKQLRDKHRKMIEQGHMKQQIEQLIQSLMQTTTQKRQILTKMTRLLVNTQQKLQCSLQQTASLFKTITSYRDQFSNCLNNYIAKNTKQHTDMLLNNGLLQYVDSLIENEKPQVKSNGICIMAQIVGNSQMDRDNMVRMDRIGRIVSIASEHPSQTYQSLSVLFMKLWKYSIDSLEISFVLNIVEKFMPLIRSQHSNLTTLLGGFQHLIKYRDSRVSSIFKKHNLLQELINIGKSTTNSNELVEVSLAITYFLHHYHDGLEQLNEKLSSYWQYVRGSLNNFDKSLEKCRRDCYFNISFILDEGNQQMLKKLVVEWDLLEVISKCLVEQKGNMLLDVFKLTEDILALCNVDYLYSSIVESRIMSLFIKAAFGYKMMSDQGLKMLLRIFRSIGHVAVLARQIDSSGILREILHGEGSEQFQAYWQFIQLAS